MDFYIDLHLREQGPEPKAFGRRAHAAIESIRLLHRNEFVGERRKAEKASRLREDVYLVGLPKVVIHSISNWKFMHS